MENKFIFTALLTIFLVLVGFAFSNPNRYLQSIAKPLEKLGIAFLIALVSSSFTGEFLINQLEGTTESISLSPLIPKSTTYLLLIATIAISYLPPIVASHINHKELQANRDKC